MRFYIVSNKGLVGYYLESPNTLNLIEIRQVAIVKSDYDSKVEKIWMKGKWQVQEGTIDLSIHKILDYHDNYSFGWCKDKNIHAAITYMGL